MWTVIFNYNHLDLWVRVNSRKSHKKLIQIDEREAYNGVIYIGNLLTKFYPFYWFFSVGECK